MVMKMNRKVPRIARLVDTFGSFAEPFLNMALDNENLEYAWKKYFTALKLSWKNEFPTALRKVNDGLKMCQKDKTLYYLLLSRKLSILIGMKDPRGDLIYVKLLKDEAKIPFVARRYVMPILLNYRPIREMEGIKKLRKARIWSKRYVDDRRTQIFLLLGNAREKVKIGEISEAFSLFLKSFRIATRIPHPLGVTDALNDMAWYMRSKHPYWSCGIAKQAVYLAGWHRENVASVFYTFDTLLECQKIVDDPQLYENANVMILANEHLPHGVGRETQEHYYDKIEFCKRIAPEFRVSKYENSDFLKNYLKNYMRSATHTYKISGVGKATILAILNGRVKMVRGNTLKKLIRALKIKPSSSDSPFSIWNEYVKMKTEDAFVRSIEKLKKIEKGQREVNFISTYMAYLSRRKSLSFLSRKRKLEEAFNLLEDLEKFKELMSKRYETMEFVNNMVNEMYPFFQARKDLARKFISKMPKVAREKFTKNYIEIDTDRPFINENNREIIDRFVRNYIRYDIKWGIDLKSVSLLQYDRPQYMTLRRVIQEFHLKRMPAILAYYAVEDGEERKRLLNVLKKF